MCPEFLPSLLRPVLEVKPARPTNVIPCQNQMNATPLVEEKVVTDTSPRGYT